MNELTNGTGKSMNLALVVDNESELESASVMLVTKLC